MRKTKEITINDRGNELTFIITEMPATKQEKLMARAISTFLGGLDMKDFDFSKFTKTKTGEILSRVKELDIDKAQVLIDELYSCVQYKAGSVLTQLTPDNVDSIIFDVKTLVSIQKEVVALHATFLPENTWTTIKEATTAPTTQNKKNTYNMRM